MTHPNAQAIEVAYDHAKFLRGAGPLGYESRMFCDLGYHVQELRGIIESLTEIARKEQEARIAIEQTRAEDTARIELLEQLAQRIGQISYGPTINGERWVLTNGENFFGATLREAIDNAGKENR